MAFVPVCKDLSKIKTKVAFNLTKRQLVCFSAAAVVGLPAYFLTKDTLGSSAAVLVMIALMLPIFFLAMYEKDDQTAEIILRNFIRTKLWPGMRPYKTENLYKYLEEEAKSIAQQDTAARAGTPLKSKHRTGKK